MRDVSTFLIPQPLPQTSPWRLSVCTSTSQGRGKPHLCFRASASEKPSNVGVAGAGIGGLATAIALLATCDTGVKRVTLFDPRSGLDVGLGGALNLNSGASVLAKCYGLAPELWSIGRPLKRVRSCVADGTAEGGDVLIEVDVEQTVRNSERGTRLLMHDDRVMTMTVMRDQLQNLLVSALPSTAEIKRGRRVSKILREGPKYRFEFTDGSTSDELFDFIVGADGVRSAVRKHVCEKFSQPLYSGVRVQFAVTSALPRPVEDSDGMVRQWFGNGAYALQYAAGGRESGEQKLLAVAFQSKLPVDENIGYESANIRRDCERRLADAGIVQRPVMEIFDRCERFIDVGVYNHKPLQSWTDQFGGCTLVGDAAHAMSPFLGAGANAAIQDAHALATALTAIGQDCENLSEALVKYERSRLSRTTAIMRSSKLIGFVETQGGPTGVPLRNNLLRLLSRTGIAAQTYLESALPTVL